eukprot:scaffold55250_cov34-Tisochrysis_lutea.AAC.4
MGAHPGNGSRRCSGSRRHRLPEEELAPLTLLADDEGCASGRIGSVPREDGVTSPLEGLARDPACAPRCSHCASTSAAAARGGQAIDGWGINIAGGRLAGRPSRPYLCAPQVHNSPSAVMNAECSAPAAIRTTRKCAMAAIASGACTVDGWLGPNSPPVRMATPAMAGGELSARRQRPPLIPLPRRWKLTARSGAVLAVIVMQSTVARPLTVTPPTHARGNRGALKLQHRAAYPVAGRGRPGVGRRAILRWRGWGGEAPDARVEAPCCDGDHAPGKSYALGRGKRHHACWTVVIDAELARAVLAAALPGGHLRNAPCQEWDQPRREHRDEGGRRAALPGSGVAPRVDVPVVRERERVGVASSHCGHVGTIEAINQRWARRVGYLELARATRRVLRGVIRRGG